MIIENVLPKQIMFSLRDLQDLGFMKISTLKKFISQGDIEAVKIGTKIFILRDEVIRYFNENIIKIAWPFKSLFWGAIGNLINIKKYKERYV